ncbi:MAG: hypothetical protein OJF50_006282, partial [Nitrospira sp.]|nr:hypothetical protein [Nitrospira sp.]
HTTLRPSPNLSTLQALRTSSPKTELNRVDSNINELTGVVPQVAPHDRRYDTKITAR